MAHRVDDSPGTPLLVALDPSNGWDVGEPNRWPFGAPQQFAKRQGAAKQAIYDEIPDVHVFLDLIEARFRMGSQWCEGELSSWRLYIHPGVQGSKGSKEYEDKWPFLQKSSGKLEK